MNALRHITQGFGGSAFGPRQCFFVFAVVVIIGAWETLADLSSKGNGGVVSRVIDADTFDVAIGADVIRVRLALIDAPEAGTYWGDIATKTMDGMVGTRVALDCEKDLGRYGRHICKVFVGDVDIGKELARRGLAKCYYLSPSDFGYRRACAIARRDSKGMYS